MTPLLDVDALEARAPKMSLPLDSEGERDDEKISLALKEATGIIVTYLPWLLDETGEVVHPIPPQFEETLLGVCADLAFFRLGDKVSSSEDALAKYQASISLLKKINESHPGGMDGPGHQEASIVTTGGEGEPPDGRFWKKGELH